MPQQQTENQQIIEYGNQHIATENLPDDFELPSEKYQQVPQIQNQNIQIQGEQEKEQNFEFKEDDNKNANKMVLFCKLEKSRWPSLKREKSGKEARVCVSVAWVQRGPSANWNR